MTPGVGLKVKIQGIFKKWYSSFLLWKQLVQIVGRTWLSLVTWTCGSWSEGQRDLYFMVQWFCVTSWRLFDICTSYFGSMNQYEPTFDFKINVGHYISWSSDFAIYLDDYLMYEHYYLGLWVSMTQSLTSKPQNKYRSLWPVFHGPVIFLENYLMYVHHTSGVWISTTRCLA